MKNINKVENFVLDITGSVEAAEFIGILWRFSQLWDDIIDNGKLPHIDNINIIMFDIIVSLNYNQFFIKYRSELLPVIKNSIFQWWAANRLETDPNEIKVEKSYMLRASFYHILNHVIYIFKGPLFMVNGDVYDSYGEKLDDLKKELGV